MNDWICLEVWRILLIVGCSIMSGGLFVWAKSRNKAILRFAFDAVSILLLLAVAYLINMVTIAGGGG